VAVVVLGLLLVLVVLVEVAGVRMVVPQRTEQLTQAVVVAVAVEQPETAAQVS
jgi:hypothetical protein